MRVVPVPRPEPRPSAWTSIRISALLEMPEPDYRRWLAALERDPMYIRLRAWGGGSIVRREPRPGTRFAWPSAAENAPDAPAGPFSLPGVDDELVGCIRKLGQRVFEETFLAGDDAASRAAAARAAGLTPAQEERVERLVDSLSFAEPAPPGPALEAPVHCVAALEREGAGYAIAYFSPHYLRGRYRVDYDALGRLKAELPAGEWERAREVVRQLELANHKLSALGRVLEAIGRLQPEYLRGGDPEALVPLRQNAVARELGLSPSAVCRALAGRSLRLPQGREVRLASFFPSTRARTERLIALVAARRPDASDEEVRRELEARHGLRITRRLVNLRRKGSAA